MDGHYPYRIVSTPLIYKLIDEQKFHSLSVQSANQGKVLFFQIFHLKFFL